MMKAAARRVGVAAVLALAAVGGCGYKPGGGSTTGNPETYVSLPETPLVATLRDFRTGEVLWTSEVPVGQQLVVRFVDKPDSEATGVSTMRWAIMPLGRRHGSLENAMACPSESGRRLEISYRHGPELHGSRGPAPAAPPAGVRIQDAPAVVTPPPSTRTPAATPRPAPAPPDTKQPPVKLPE